MGWAKHNICPSWDHLAAQMVLKLNSMETEYKWNFHKANWKGFNAEVEKSSVKEVNAFEGTYERLSYPNQWHYQRVEDVSEAIEEDIWQGITRNAKKEKVTPKAPHTSWFTKELKEMKKKLKYISNAIRKSIRQKKGRVSRYTYADFQNYRRKYKYAIRAAQKVSFRTYMSDHSSDPRDISFIGKKILRRNRTTNLGALVDDQGQLLDPQGSMELAADTHFVDSQPIHPNQSRQKN